MSTLVSSKKTYIDPRDLPPVEVSILRRILTYLHPYRRDAALVLIAVLLSAFLSLLPPFLVRRAVDEAIPAGNLRLLFLLCAAIIGSALVAGLLGVWQKSLSAAMGEAVTRDLRVELFENLQAQPYRYFVTAKPGEAISSVVNDVQGVGSAVSSTLVDAAEGSIALFTTAGALFLLDWRLALATLAFLPCFVLPTRPVGQERKRIRRAVQARMAELTGILDEALSVSGILLTRIFGAAPLEAARVRAKTAEIEELSLRQARVGRWLQMLVGLFEGAGPALVFGFGGYLVVRGRIAIGTVVAFAALLRRLYSSASSLTGVHVSVLTSYAYFDRVFRVLEMEPEHAGRPDAVLLPRVRGALSLREVSFSYGEGAESLSEVSLDIEPGECVAVVGPSGAGKSTLVSLMLRLHDPSKGAVLLDGHDLRTLDLESLRSHVGVVTQETYLFFGSILENLRYGRPGASLSQVEAAARAAQIHDFVASLPQGYDTMVGRRGYRLSGGERQRLAIARVILKDPRILILDEATSSLDSRNEALVQAALDPLLRDRTSLVIAHRLSTIRRASFIVVFDEGRIAERGTHDRLLDANGLYANLYREQFRDAWIA